MTKQFQTCPCGQAAPSALPSRFPDLNHRFRIGWREVLRGLFGPANRVHRYRNLSAAMFDAATRRLDDCEE